MFIPIGDENPTRRRPVVTYAIVAMNVAAFLLMQTARSDETLIRWLLIPADWSWRSLVTSMFLHDGFFHILFNMLFLWIFGDNVEDRLGRIGYTVFYFASGLAAAAAHIASDPASVVPTLGASGAVSGVMGAYIVFFPRHHVKMFLWVFIFAGIVRTPAFLWIGVWFFQQVFYNAVTPNDGGGGVAYVAHIAGFVAGAAVAGVFRVIADRRTSSPAGPDMLDAKISERRPFHAPPDRGGIDFIDEPAGGYSVLRLRDDANDVAPISNAVAPITRESSFDVVDRLVVTRGMIARSIPRDAARRIQAELHTLGIPSAIILHNRSNFPPSPVAAETVSWDARAIRFRAGDQVVMIPWTAPFLVAGARIEGRPFIDVFVNRNTAYRIPGSRAIPIREVDPDGRTETPSDLAAFARAAIDRGRGAAVNEGVRAIARGDASRLDFRAASDYDDYIFWLYNLILAQNPQP